VSTYSDRVLLDSKNGHHNVPKQVLDGGGSLEAGLQRAEALALLPRKWKVSELVECYPNLRMPVIEGFLRAGEVCNIIAKSKAGKSWAALGQILSVATGRKWMGRFVCRQCKVWLIDNELHHEVIAQRIPKVAAAMGLSLEDYDDWLDVTPLRGDMRGVHDLTLMMESTAPDEYGLIVLDAFYRILPDGTSENANAEMTIVYNQVDRWARLTGAAFVLVHHASKGSQSEKDVTDVGSGAGAQSRAVDTHLILRPHEEPDCVVLDAAVRSWPPVEPMVLRWTFPIWTPADDLDPEKLKGKKPSEDQAETDNAVIDACQTWRARSEIEEATGLTRGKINRAIVRLMGKKLLEEDEQERRNNPKTAVFRKTIHAR